MKIAEYFHAAPSRYEPKAEFNVGELRATAAADSLIVQREATKTYSKYAADSAAYETAKAKYEAAKGGSVLQRAFTSEPRPPTLVTSKRLALAQRRNYIRLIFHSLLASKTPNNSTVSLQHTLADAEARTPRSSGESSRTVVEMELAHQPSSSTRS